MAVVLSAAQAIGQEAVAPVVPDIIGADSANGLTLTAFAAPMLTTGAGVSVLVGAELGRESHTGSDRTAAHELRVELVNGAGAVQARSAQIAGGPEGTAGDGVFRSLFRFQLEPGRFTLRVTVSGAPAAPRLSLIRPLDVPDLWTTAVSVPMSGLLLAASGSSGHVVTDEGEEHRQLPILLRPPTTRRTFATNERLETFVEVYDWQSELEFDQQLGIVTRVRTPDGALVYASEDIGQSETLTSGRFGYAHSALVPIDTLSPGRYLVEVEARRLDGTSPAVVRSVPIEVRAPIAP